MSMKNSNDAIGYRASDLPACSAASQLTVPLRAPHSNGAVTLFNYTLQSYECHFGSARSAREVMSAVLVVLEVQGKL